MSPAAMRSVPLGWSGEVISTRPKRLATARMRSSSVATITSFANVYFQDTQHLLDVGAQRLGRTPVIVVDRYSEILSLQLLTAGMDRRRETIVSTLRELLAPRAIVGRNDSSSRELEGLPRRVEMLYGETP